MVFPGQPLRWVPGEQHLPFDAIVELRPRLRIAVRSVDRSNDETIDSSLNVARLLVARIARKFLPGQHGLLSAGKDGNAVPRFLPLPQGTLAGPLELVGGESQSSALSSCKQISPASPLASKRVGFPGAD